MSDNPTPAAGDNPESDDKPAEGDIFTQADVDKIVGKARTEERRKASEKYADYDDLRTKAGEKATVEEQLAELREQLASTQIQATRASVAARFGISTEPGKDGEPSDAELFLTGTDEDTLTAQAQRLAARESERKKSGNRVPREGNTPSDSPKGSSWSGVLAGLDARQT